jgi:Protein of unknown function (DUF3105)
VRRIFIVAGLLPFPAAVLFGACGGNTTGDDDSGVDGSSALADTQVPDRARLPAPIHPDASCAVTIDTPVLLASPHVAIGTPVEYDSNPPSSGPHYPIWAAFQEFMTPVDRRYYVHDLEHGAVVLLYKCDDAAGCPDVVQGMRDLVASLGDDPLCDKSTGPRVRIVITPDPLIPTTVAAAAWGWTYTADCFDLPSLKAFVLAHYGQGTEMLCANGQTQF